MLISRTNLCDSPKIPYSHRSQIFEYLVDIDNIWSKIVKNGLYSDGKNLNLKPPLASNHEAAAIRRPGRLGRLRPELHGRRRGGVEHVQGEVGKRIVAILEGGEFV